MASKTAYNFTKGQRKKDVDNCKQCNGAPISDTVNLQGMETTYCTTCMNVISWCRTGQPTTIIKKERISVPDTVRLPANLEVTTELTPGFGTKLSFGNLKVE